MFVKPVEDGSDTFAFRYDFNIEGKAVEDGAPQTITEDENGDLIIEGYAAVFEGDDRQGENFAPGAFQRGIKSFLGSTASLNFHHKHDHGIGKVLELEEEEGKGLRMKARVDFQPESSPLRYIYNGVKKGTYNGLSVGGFFKRAYMEGKRKIADMDFTEISVTPVPVHPGPSFAVVAGKALEDIQLPSKPDNVNGEIRADDEEMIGIYIDGLKRIFDNIGSRGNGQQPITGGAVL